MRWANPSSARGRGGVRGGLGRAARLRSRPRPPDCAPLGQIANDNRRDTMADSQTFVIVGASLAGAKAAEALRAEGFDGRIVLVGEEPVRPYERPPLSKGYLLGRGGLRRRRGPRRGLLRRRVDRVTHVHHRHGDRSHEQGCHPLPGLHLALRPNSVCRPVPCPGRCRFPGRTWPDIHYLRSIESCDALAVGT